MAIKNMARLFTSLAVAISLATTSSFAFAVDSRSAVAPQDEHFDKVVLVLESKSQPSSTKTSMPWGSSVTYRADIYWQAGDIEDDPYFANVTWELTDASGQETQAWFKTWSGTGDDGRARIKIFAPYGITATMKLKATSKIDNALSDTLTINVFDGTSVTGKYYYRTDTGYDLVNPQIWDKSKGTYSMKLPDIPSDVLKDKYITSFYWTAISVKNKYEANSIISHFVDQYEKCDIDVTGYVFIPPEPLPKSYKSIKNVRAIPTDDGRAQVSWSKVIKAKGYFVYSYNFKTKKYKKVKTLNYDVSTYYETKKVKKKTVFKFKVQSYKIVNDKKVEMKTSYPVSVVVGTDKVSNAQKVALNTKKTTISKKVGKTTKLKATVQGTEGLKLYSKKVRWFTTNKEIATVSKSGKVKFVKKGSCKVYAIAHNGKKSKSIKIKVK